MHYRRSDVAAGSDFFMVNPAERKRTLLVDNMGLLRKVMTKGRQRHPLHIETMVVLMGQDLDTREGIDERSGYGKA